MLQFFKRVNINSPLVRVINLTHEGPGQDGFGKVSGKELTVTEKGLNQFEEYLQQQGFMDDYENIEMVKRLENALKNGEKITGADAVYYLHELKEASLVNSGILQPVAHDMAIEFYGVSPYSVYHPDVIQMEPGWWNNAWFEFWGIER